MAILVLCKYKLFYALFSFFYKKQEAAAINSQKNTLCNTESLWSNIFPRNPVNCEELIGLYKFYIFSLFTPHLQQEKLLFFVGRNKNGKKTKIDKLSFFNSHGLVLLFCKQLSNSTHGGVRKRRPSLYLHALLFTHLGFTQEADFWYATLYLPN